MLWSCDNRLRRCLGIALPAILCCAGTTIVHAQVKVTRVRPASSMVVPPTAPSQEELNQGAANATTNLGIPVPVAKSSDVAVGSLSAPQPIAKQLQARAQLDKPKVSRAWLIPSGVVQNEPPEVPEVLQSTEAESFAQEVIVEALPMDALRTTEPAESVLSIQDEQTSDPSMANKAIAVPTILKNAQSMPVNLRELIRTSLESRRIFNSLSGGVVVESLTAFDPQIASQQIIAEQSQFDPSVSTNLQGNHVDRPPDSFFGPGLSQNNRRHEAEFNYRLSKIWPTGLSTSIGYEPSLAYLFFPAGSSSGFNPTHSSDLVLRATQPLLRGGNKQANLATLRIAERRLMQNRLEVEATIQRQLRSIEQAYWALHANHVRLKAIDEAIILAQKTVELVQLRYEAERTIYADVARAQVKLEDLFQQRLDAELDIRKDSFDLSQLVGFEFGNDRVLIPTDNPENRVPQFDSAQVVTTALQANPALRRQRQEIEIRRTVVVSAENQMLPRLDLQALHRTSGLDNDLGTSIQQMAGLEFNDFSVGLQYSQQLGLRQGRSRVQSAKLESAREAALLSAFERQVGFDILKSLSQLELSYSRYESALRQLAQSQQWVQLAQIRYEDPPLRGSGQESLLVSLLDYQSALQARVDALVLVAEAIADYNVNLAVIEEKRGSMLTRWGIATQSDCELPQHDSQVVNAIATQTRTAPDQTILPGNSSPAPVPQSSSSNAMNPTTIRSGQ
jgi:outer membrane protein TolC